MVEISITYEGDLHCDAVHGRQESICPRTRPRTTRAKARPFSPTDLVGAALGTCMMTTMAIARPQARHRAARRPRQGHQGNDHRSVRRIGKLSVEFHIPLDLSDDDKKRLENAAYTCPVHKGLHPDVQVPITFRWGA